MENSYLESATKQFVYYKSLGEKAIAQMAEEDLFKMYNPDSNSVAIIVKHLWGNMLSRWTDFLTSDGEKDWREREAEFENDLQTRKNLLQKWEEGWQVLFEALKPLQAEDLERIVYIRNQGHTVVEAINRQLAHYAYHVGQIVFLAKLMATDGWQSLSIPRGESGSFNQKKFSQAKEKKHFTDEFVDPREG